MDEVLEPKLNTIIHRNHTNTSTKFDNDQVNYYMKLALEQV